MNDNYIWREMARVDSESRNREVDRKAYADFIAGWTCEFCKSHQHFNRCESCGAPRKGVVMPSTHPSTKWVKEVMAGFDWEASVKNHPKTP